MMRDWQHLTEILLTAAGDAVAEQAHPTWVRVFDRPNGEGPDGFSLGFCEDPDALLGWVAPPDCEAVGVIATGRLRALPGGPRATGIGPRPAGMGPRPAGIGPRPAGIGPRPAGIGPRPAGIGLADGRVRMACLVTRAGDTAWKMVLPDGMSAPEVPSEGRMLDCLRRCFGLPTPPPPAGAGRVQAVAWLAAILEAAEEARRPLRWSDVARLHPVAQVLGGRDLDGSAAGPGLVLLAGSAGSWEDFRRQVAVDRGLEEIMAAELAEWMDEGMFARWILADLPSPDLMLAAARPHLAPSAARRLAHAVRDASRPTSAGAVG